VPKKSNPAAPFWRQMRDAERSILSYALECGGSITKGAELLGISVPYMSERTHELGIIAPAPARRGRPVAVSGDGGGSEADDEAHAGNPERERPAPPNTCSPAFVLVPGGVDDVVTEDPDDGDEEGEDEDDEDEDEDDEDEDGEDGEEDEDEDGEDGKDGEDDGGKAV
jgi:hypothetical protein